ncbi:MAG: TlpA disulfide reductase family protein [Clostridium sp.]|uniref:TlpA family protein disulfide reductase n=1 Tax=Clostridium sp. TaxID=1506 RepID=UPI002FC6D97C
MGKLIGIILIMFMLLGCESAGIDTGKVPVNLESGSQEGDASKQATPISEEALQSMPSFETLNLDGKKVSSDDFKGKITIINFFNTWNADSTKEIDILGLLQKEYVNKGIEIVYISSNDKIEDIKKFGKEHPITSSHLLLDGDGKIGKLFKVDKIPTTYIINRDSAVVARYARVIDKNEMKLVLDALQ